MSENQASAGLFTEELGRAHHLAGPGGELLLVPPVCGFTGALRARIAAFAALHTSRFARIRLVEFSGQNGRPGSFSVTKSAEALTALLHTESDRCFTLFGMCSGAAASVQAATRAGNVARLFLWEMSPRYVFDRLHWRYYERRFGLSVCERTILLPIQPIELVPRLRRATLFANAGPSIYCNDAGQDDMARNTLRGQRATIAGASHFLDGTNTICRLGQTFDAWIESAATCSSAE